MVAPIELHFHVRLPSLKRTYRPDWFIPVHTAFMQDGATSRRFVLRKSDSQTAYSTVHGTARRHRIPHKGDLSCCLDDVDFNLDRMLRQKRGAGNEINRSGCRNDKQAWVLKQGDSVDAKTQAPMKKGALAHASTPTIGSSGSFKQAYAMIPSSRMHPRRRSSWAGSMQVSGRRRLFSP